MSVTASVEPPELSGNGHRTPRARRLFTIHFFKASCLCLYPDPVVAQPVVPVAWPRVSVQLAAAPVVPAVAVAVARVVAAAVAHGAAAPVVEVAVAYAVAAAVAEPEPREAVPVLPAFPVLSAVNQYAVKLAPLYAVPAARVVAA